ncbi:hypothetical protein Hanom_Chr15g01343571 [Helianthus anomalus]
MYMRRIVLLLLPYEVALIYAITFGVICTSYVAILMFGCKLKITVTQTDAVV